jgi:ATP-dependent RNA helicase DeaD
VQLLAAAMKLLTGDKKGADVELTPEDPVRGKKRKFEGARSGYGSQGGQGGNRRYGQGGGQGGQARGSYSGGAGGYGGQGRGGQQRKPYAGGTGVRPQRDDGGFRDGGSRGSRPDAKSPKSSEDFVNI